MWHLCSDNGSAWDIPQAWEGSPRHGPRVWEESSRGGQGAWKGAQEVVHKPEDIQEMVREPEKVD